jgi:predicted deacylase
MESVFHKTLWTRSRGFFSTFHFQIFSIAVKEIIDKRRDSMKKILLSLFVLMFLFATPVYALPSAVPNGSWLQDAHSLQWDQFHSYGELVKELKRIEQSSHGKVQLEVIGKSNQGRDIYLAKVGTGAKKVMFITQQHGDEPLGTEAALQLLKKLGTSNLPEMENIREEVTLYVIVRANPDGAETLSRYNYDPNADSLYGEKGKGYDVNRYHSPSMRPENNPVPEAAAIRRAYDRYKPDIVVDFHHQGNNGSEDSGMITTFVYWPNNENVSPKVVNLSKEVCLVIHDTLTSYGFSEVRQYQGGTYEGIARNAYALLGSGSVLVEIRGDFGEKNSDRMLRTAYASMFGVLEAVAEGTLQYYNPADADHLPQYEPSIGMEDDEGE